MRIKQVILKLFLLLIVSSCIHKTQEVTTKIRGKIVNPKTDKVLISRDFLMLTADTLKLKYENKIYGEVKTPREGLYFIYIFPEFQTIYLKPGDSLAFHINVDEFDESLSFSGSIGFENNLLLELYLENEKESAYFYDHQFNFDAKTFLKKIDSFTAINKKLINSYQKELEKSDKKYREIIALYHNSLQYSLKEAYLKKHPDESIEKEYVNYCQTLHNPLPDPNIIYMYAFADNYIERKLQKNKDKNIETFLKIAQTIEKEIYDKEFKDNLLIKYCLRYIKSQKIFEKDSTISYYLSVIQNDTYKNYCKKLINKNKQIKNGKLFPNISVRNKQNKLYKLNEFLKDQKTLISFWNLDNRKNFISNLEKLEKIKEKHPKLQIIILNLNPQSQEEWMLQVPVNSKFMYLQLTREEDVHTVSPYHLAQIFLIDSLQIKNSLQNMYTTDFEKKLEEFMQ